MLAGEFSRRDWRGRWMVCLGWESGTRSVTDGADLASVARSLPIDRLYYWRDRLAAQPFERAKINQEIDRRDPAAFWEMPLFRTLIESE